MADFFDWHVLTGSARDLLGHFFTPVLHMFYATFMSDLRDVMHSGYKTYRLQPVVAIRLPETINK